MKAKGNYTPTQLEFIERIRRSAAISSGYGEMYAPENGGMPRLVYPANRVENLETGFKGEVLDISSRAAVRSVVTGYVKSHDLLPDRPGDISFGGRRYLILKCRRKLEQKERKRAAAPFAGRSRRSPRRSTTTSRSLSCVSAYVRNPRRQRPSSIPIRDG